MGTSRTTGGGGLSGLAMAPGMFVGSCGGGGGGGDCRRVSSGGDLDLWRGMNGGGLITEEGVCGGGENGLSSIVILGLIDRLYPGINRAGEERADEGDIGISTMGLGDRFGMKSF